MSTPDAIESIKTAFHNNDAALLRQYAHDRTFFARLDNDASIVAAIEAVRGYLQTTPQSALHLPTEFTRYSRANLAAQLATFLDGIYKN